MPTCFCSLTSLDERQFLPRESILRKTKWIYGVAVYTGHETKLMLNQTVSFVKKSKIDTILSSQIKIVFLSISILSFICATCSMWWTKLHFESHWYLEINGNTLSLSIYYIFFNISEIMIKYRVVMNRNI